MGWAAEALVGVALLAFGVVVVVGFVLLCESAWGLRCGLNTCMQCTLLLLKQ